MSKLAVGQKVTLHVPSTEIAQNHSIHLLDESQPVVAEIVFINQDSTVNVIAFDHVGSVVALKNVEASKPKDESVLYVSALK